MCNLPIHVANSEKIVRAIMSPYHVDRKGRLRPRAFRPASGTDEVSVIRQSHMGSDFCKDKAKEIAERIPGKTYIGLASVSAEQIRSTGAQIVDSRAEFCGHAHISYGIVVQRDEPQQSELNRRLTEFARKILDLAIFRIDPDPSAPTWTGEAL